VALAKKLAGTMGINPDRIRLSWIPASEGPRFAAVVNEFTSRINELGDNPSKEEVYI
ncbi:MAG: hydrogenase iron-sulfur subunit, partial [Desulfobacterales bacterium]|nr:hydrogenase iron-sulfur subunit [Desulfobacterales bacterium]